MILDYRWFSFDDMDLKQLYDCDVKYAKYLFSELIIWIELLWGRFLIGSIITEFE